jgi:hypothetical protein
MSPHVAQKQTVATPTNQADSIEENFFKCFVNALLTSTLRILTTICLISVTPRVLKLEFLTHFLVFKLLF